jgi:hypothetical protein
MKRQRLATLFAALLLTVFYTTATTVAFESSEEDTDTKMVAARVVEVTEMRISVIARSGVEHVIAIDGAGTKVKVDGRLVSLKDVREGDIITVELDEKNPVKFAKNIEVGSRSNADLVARAHK